MSDSSERKLPSRTTFVSLRGRNYRRYFFALIFSNSGTWVQIVAEGWLVLQLTNSPLMLGLTAMVHFTPILLLGLFAGAVVDRVDRRRVLLVTQCAAAVLALAMGTLSALSLLSVWVVWVAALLLGVIKSFDQPAMQAFTKELVGPRDLTNALALNSTIATSSWVVGPLLGGVIFHRLGAPACFFINAGTFAIVIIVLLTLDRSALYPVELAVRGPGQIRAGIEYIRNSQVLSLVFIAITLVFTVAYNFQVVLPLVATQVFHADSQFYGQLMSALALGGLTGSLLIASRAKVGLRQIGISAIVLSSSQVFLALATERIFVFAASFLLGLSATLFIVVANGTVQSNIQDSMRGRVMSMYSMTLHGTGVVGGPLIGGFAEGFGVSYSFALSAAVCGGVALLLFLRRVSSPLGEEEAALHADKENDVRSV